MSNIDKIGKNLYHLNQYIKETESVMTNKIHQKRFGVAVRGINRMFSPIDLMVSTRRALSISSKAMNSFPKFEGLGSTSELEFFYGGKGWNIEDLIANFFCEKLVFADPYDVLAYNRANPEFADSYPHLTIWRKIPSGEFYFMLLKITGSTRTIELNELPEVIPFNFWWAGNPIESA